MTDRPAAAVTGLRRATWAVLLLVLALRLVHFAAASQSPLTYQIGPDEDYYLRFGMDVAFGSGGLRSEFTFMDPLYGYLLGAVLWLSGGSVFPAYVLQLLVDCATAFGLLMVGRALGRPRIGLLAAALYALLGPAMAFSMSLLKATWVAAFVCWWMVAALRLSRPAPAWAWLAFGLYCGLGIALRSNLLLLVALGALLVPWLLWRAARPAPRALVLRIGLMLAGIVLPLLLLTARNHLVDQRLSPVPTNGGVVLHQLYNDDNPRSLSGAPPFVAYGHPSEIWRGYNAEAERRTGRAMPQREVEAYWRGEARTYLLAHPWQSLRNGLRKLGEFTAYTEVPNNRSYADERLFSPLLRWLPQPFGWLFALGVPGLVLLVRRDPRALVLLAPVAMGLVTVGVFFAEDRFRFNIVTPFVLGSAAWLACAWAQWRQRRWRSLAMLLAVSALLGALSLWQASRIPPTPTDWQRIATGQYRMGDRAGVEHTLADTAARDPDAVGLHEFRGLLLLADGLHAPARRAFEAALAQRQDRHEVWHNYATAMDALGEHDAALAAEATAYGIVPLPEYAFRIGALLEALGRLDEARAVYASLAAAPDGSRWGPEAASRLQRLGTDPSAAAAPAAPR